jgi:hypothetical protein
MKIISMFEYVHLKEQQIISMFEYVHLKEQQITVFKFLSMFT